MKKKSTLKTHSKKSLEEELFQKNKELIRLKKLMYLSNNLSKTGAWELDIKTGIVFWDWSTKEIMKVPMDFNPTIEEAINFYKEGKERDAYIKAAYDAGKNGTGYDITCIAISAKKEEILIRTIGKAVMENGKCVRFYGSFQDVTEQKVQERKINQQNIKLAFQNNELSVSNRKIKESEKTFKDLFNNSTDLIYVLNFDGRFIDVNKNVIKTYGYSKDYIIGKTPIIFGAPDQNDLQKLDENIKKAIGGKTVNFKWWAKKKNGDIFLKEVTIRKGRYFGKDMLIAVARNITEKEITANQLKESEKKYKSIFNSLLDVYYEAGKDGVIEIVSPAIESLLGYKPKEVIGKEAESFYKNPEDRAILRTSLRKQGFLNNYRLTLINKENKGVPVEASIKIKHDKNNNSYKYVAMLRDVTEKKEAEKKLIESEKKYKSIFNSLIDTYYRTNTDGVVLEISPSIYGLTGYYPSEIIGNKFADNLDTKKYRNEILKSSMTKILNYPISIQHKNGENVEVELNVTILYDEKGNFLGTEGIARNITIKKSAQEQINKLSIAVEQGVNTVIITDITGIIEYANQRLTVKTGFKLDEVIGKNIGITLSKNHTKEFYKDVWNTVLSGIPWNGVVQSVKKNGDSFWENVTITPIKNDKGEVINFLSVKEDITERKKIETFLENEKKRMLKAQYEGEENEKNRISTELHDGLGQILTAAKFSLKAIENQKTLDAITKNKIRTVKNLINDANIETRRISRSLLPRILEDFGLEKATEKMLRDIQNAFNIRAFLSVNPQTKIIKETEKIVYRIIQESVNNAVKHSKLSVLEVSFDSTDKYNIFTISDNGKGFDTKLVSTGLGLDNLKQRALSIDAYLDIQSDKKKGTTIVLKIKRNGE